MAIQSNIAGVVQVMFEAQTRGFEDDVERAERTYKGAAGEISDSAMKVELANARLRRELDRTPASADRLARAERALAREQRALELEQRQGATTAGRFAGQLDRTAGSAGRARRGLGGIASMFGGGGGGGFAGRALFAADAVNAFTNSLDRSRSSADDLKASVDRLLSGDPVGALSTLGGGLIASDIRTIRRPDRRKVTTAAGTFEVRKGGLYGRKPGGGFGFLTDEEEAQVLRGTSRQRGVAPSTGNPLGEGRVRSRTVTDDEVRPFRTRRTPTPRIGPLTELPRAMSDALLAAQLSPGERDDLREARREERFWRKQLERAKKGSEAYSTILAEFVAANRTVEALEADLAGEQKRHDDVVTKTRGDAAARRARAAERRAAAQKRARERVEATERRERHAQRLELARMERAYRDELIDAGAGIRNPNLVRGERGGRRTAEMARRERVAGAPAGRDDRPTWDQIGTLLREFMQFQVELDRNRSNVQGGSMTTLVLEAYTRETNAILRQGLLGPRRPDRSLDEASMAWCVERNPGEGSQFTLSGHTDTQFAELVDAFFTNP